MMRHGGGDLGTNNNILTLEAFQRADHSPATIISQLTGRLIEQSKDDGGSFDPAPFIKTLESAVDTLVPLRQKVSDQTSALETQVRESERTYSSKVGELRQNFDTVARSFSHLEDRIAEVGRTAIRIGEQLESIDKLRQRASETHDIISYYHDAASGDMTRLEHLRTSAGREGRAKVAGIARRLSAVAKEVEEIEGGVKTREAIDRFCERFEKDVLKIFDKSYRKGDPKLMAHCAKTLLEFNGGQSCIQVYVNQHDFFITRDRVQDANNITNSTIWRTLAEPDCVAPDSEEHLTALFEEIKVVVDQEAQIIQAVFPNPAAVMQTFLQRVFAQVVQAYIEKILEVASSLSNLAFLRVLHLTRSSLTSLIEHLKNHDFFRVAPAVVSASSFLATTTNTETSTTDALISASNSTSGVPGNAGAAALSAMLDQAMNEIFLPYLEGTRYMDKERKNLSELYAGHLLPFVNWHKSISKSKGSNIFDRVVNQLQTTSGSSPTTATGGLDRSKSIKNFMKLGSSSDNQSSNSTGLSNGIGGNGGIDTTATEEDGMISLDIAESLFRWHAEAIGRMVELSPASDVPRNAFTLLKVLADSYCKIYIETGLDSALTQIPAAEDIKSEPDLEPLKVLQTADTAMALWKHYVSTALIPLMGSSITVRREMAVFNNHNNVKLEGKMSSLVKRALHASMAWLSVLLSKQKKFDFRPKNDDFALMQINTEPCILVSEFLACLKKVIDESLNSKNREAVLIEIGISFHSALLEHLKKFSVSATGGLMLTKDLAVYQDAFTGYNVPAISDRFEMLRQLGNLFIVQPDILKTYMSESHLASVDSRLLRPYLMQRTDYGEYSRKFWDDVCGGEVVDGGRGYEGSGNKITARLGGLMDLENFKMGFSGTDDL